MTGTPDTVVTTVPAGDRVAHRFRDLVATGLVATLVAAGVMVPALWWRLRRRAG